MGLTEDLKLGLCYVFCHTVLLNLIQVKPNIGVVHILINRQYFLYTITNQLFTQTLRFMVSNSFRYHFQYLLAQYGEKNIMLLYVNKHYVTMK